MATNRKLRKDLLAILGGVSHQRLSQLVAKIKRTHGPMTTEEATYVLAQQRGLPLDDYLDGPTMDRVRTLVPRTLESEAPAPRKGNRSSSKKITITINSDVRQLDQLLSVTLASDARDMASVYPKYYVLENTVRYVIKRVLEKKHGLDWWASKVAKRVKDEVASRILKEQKQPWHGKRGQHEIFYSDFHDLINIINANFGDFKHIFPSQQWITQKLEELEHPRNVLAHHNPLSIQDKKRIELYYQDIITLLFSKKDQIPQN
jgi:hypothetical protein